MGGNHTAGNIGFNSNHNFYLIEPANLRSSTYYEILRIMASIVKKNPLHECGNFIN
jgi:hypothetical protein